MKKSLGYVALALLVIVVGVTLIFSKKSNTNTSFPTKSEQKTTSVVKCDGDLQLSRAEKELQGNQSALEIIKNNCLILVSSFKADLQNNGTQDLVFWGVGAGCGSCHAKEFYILSPEGKVLYNDELDDPQIEVKAISQKKNILVIKQPIRKDNESYSSPSEFETKNYSWNKRLNLFGLFIYAE